jgi:hypothetical protein
MAKPQKSLRSIAAPNLKDMRQEWFDFPQEILSSAAPGSLAEMPKLPQTNNSTLTRLIERIKKL